ncbi:MAG: tetratricopeptide repeat protein, partial [Candidatus Thorarchaeota archaeon]
MPGQDNIYDNSTNSADGVSQEIPTIPGMTENGKFRLVKSMSQKTPVCNQCKSPITLENKLLRCHDCERAFCEKCEKKIAKEDSFYDGFENHKLYIAYILCEDCYKININREKELLTMHRRFLQLRDTLPQDPETWFSTAERFKDSGLYDLARLCFNEAINIKDDYINKVIDIWQATGSRLYSESRFEEAISCFDEALSLDAKLENAWLNKGKSLESTGNLSEALVSFDKVLRLNDKNVEALSKKGYVLGKMKNPKGAEKCFNLALEFDSNNEFVWLNKAQYHIDADEYPKAIESANSALKINSDNEFSWVAKWQGLMNIEDYSNAIDCCNEILTRGPDSAIGWKCYGDTLLKLDKFDEAVEAYDKSLRSDPMGRVIDVNEIRKIKHEILSALGEAIPAPDWMKEGNFIEYDYSDNILKGKERNVNLVFKRLSDDSITIFETDEKDETNEIKLDLGLENTLKGSMIYKYWLSSECEKGERIPDLDKKEYIMRGVDDIQTPLGTIKCWRLEARKVKDKGLIQINSWFDLHSGLLIKKSYSKQFEGDKPKQWEILLKETNIQAVIDTAIPDTVAPEIEEEQMIKKEIPEIREKPEEPKIEEKAEMKL